MSDGDIVEWVDPETGVRGCARVRLRPPHDACHFGVCDLSIVLGVEKAETSDLDGTKSNSSPTEDPT